MTRKKQGAPQKLPGESDASSDIKIPAREFAAEKAEHLNQTSPTLDKSSCDKLLAFTMDFLSKRAKTFHEAQGADGSRGHVTGDSGRIQLDNSKPDLSNFDQSLPKSSVSIPENLLSNPDYDKASNGISKLPFADVASLTAANCVAMLQQQLYGQYPNDWIHIQRNDNNCLSKSKAERYRWCVQGGANGATANHQKHMSGSSANSQVPISNARKAPHPASVPNNGQAQDRLFGPVFAGASKFHCRDCGSSFCTLVDLTVHMNETGHFRDTNQPNSSDKNHSADDPLPSTNAGKVKGRSSLDEDSTPEKVLTCMGCGNLFDSLQDLSVHMIKTKHYEKVPSWRIHLTPVNGSNNDKLPKKKPPVNHSRINPARKPEAQPEALDLCALTQPSLFYPLFGAMANPAAAYAASLLYSAPWLSSAFLPSILGSGYPIPPGLLTAGGALPQFPSRPFLKCTECPKVFINFQEMSKHHETHLSRKTSSSPSGSNDSSSSASIKSETCAPTEPWLESDSARKDADSSTSFDFIKSLESTIQSAISKVETPRCGASQSRVFNPFTSSIKSNPAPHPSRGKRRSSESPLDLTVKRDDPQVEESNFTSSPIPKNPLECLKENMESMFPDATKRRSHPQNKSFSNLFSTPLHHQDHISSNPLQEMLKIVRNATSDTPKDRTGSKRRSEEVEAEVTEKKPRVSILRDLVTPQDPSSSSSTVNPIQQMQDLVNSKISPNRCAPQKPPASSYAPPSVLAAKPSTSNAFCSPVTSLAEFVSSSRFSLPHESDSTRGETGKNVHHQEADLGESWKDYVTMRQEIQLLRRYVTAFHSCRHDVTDKNLMEEFLSSTRFLPGHVVKAWLKSTCGKFPSLLRDSNYKCSFCSTAESFTKLENFLEHLDSHIENLSTSPRSDNCDTVTSQPQKPSVRFQGSVCFSSFDDSVHSPKQMDVMGSTSSPNSTPSDIKRFNHKPIVEEQDSITVSV